MKQNFQFFRNCFHGKLCRLFFAASLIICGIIFRSRDFFPYLEKITGTAAPPTLTGKTSSGYICSLGDLSIYTSDRSMISEFSFVIFLLLPSTVTAAIVEGLKNGFLNLSPESLKLLAIPIFAAVNSGYWILLGYFIESIHTYVLKNKTARQNPLSIYSRN